METIIIFAIVMLISSLTKPKKRSTQTGKKTQQNQPATPRKKKKNIFEQMEMEIRNLTEQKKPTLTQEVFREKQREKSFKEEVAQLIKDKEKASEQKPILEDRFAYYNPEPEDVTVPLVVEDLKKASVVDLKKAIIMSEVLDKPVYLRRRH